MARCLFKQAALLRLAGSKLARSRLSSKDIGLDVPVDKFYRMTDGRPHRLAGAGHGPGSGGTRGRPGERAHS